MKRHVSLLVCAILCIAMSLTLVACNASAHQHTYSDEWSYNETNHWHIATCNEEGCGTAKGSDLAHADADKNKICDVCGYDYNHEHSYAEEVSSDAKGHWYAVACGCSIDTNKDPHYDKNNDGVCDLCKYGNDHEHEINENAWAYDENDHWNPVECGHSVEEKESHDYDEVGVCAVCGYVENEIDVESAVAMGDYYQGLTNGATIIGSSDTWGSITDTYIEYVLGNQSSYISTSVPAWDESNEYWYMLYNGTIFAVQVDSFGDAFKPYDPASALVNGYAFEDLFGYEGGEDTRTYYGVNDLVAGLYELAAGYNVYEYVMVLDGVTYYNFEFDYSVMVYDWELEMDVYKVYSVSVSFSLTEDYTYDNVYVSSAKYDAEAVWSEDEEPVVVDVYATTLLPTTIRIYSAQQTTGARDLEFAYSPEDVLMQDFVLVDHLGNEVEETVTVPAGGSIFLTFDSVSPETAVIGLNNIDVMSDMLSANYWDGTVSIYAGAPGEYTFDLVINGVTTTYNVNVTTPAVTELLVYVDDVDVTENGVTVFSTPGQSVSVTFSVEANAYANNAIEYMLPPMLLMSGATVTNNGDGTYTLTLNPDMGGYAEGMVMLTSVENPDISVILYVTVVPAPSVADFLNGTYVGEIMDYRFNQYGMTNLEVTFTPAAEGATNGTVTFHVYYSSMFGEADYIDVLNYNYDATTGEFTTELVSTNTDTVDGIPLAITFDASSYTVSVMGMMGSATLTAGTASGGDSGAATLDIAGEYIYNIYKEDGYSLDSRYQLIINADGTGTFKYRTWNKSNYTWTDTYTTTFTWTVAADGVSFDLVVADYTYLQSGNYAYGSWTNEGLTYEGILAVVILNDTTPAAYNLELF